MQNYKRGWAWIKSGGLLLWNEMGGAHGFGLARSVKDLDRDGQDDYAAGLLLWNGVRQDDYAAA